MYSFTFIKYDLYWGSSFYCYSQIFMEGFLQQILSISVSSFFKVLEDFPSGYPTILLWKQLGSFVCLFK